MTQKRSKPNWRKIKAEYVRGGISQQKLADKYGIHRSTLCNRINSEGWQQLRKEATAKAGQKLVQKISDAQAETMAQMIALHDKAGLTAFRKLLQQLEEFPESEATTKVVKQSEKIQEVDMGEGREAAKVPLKTFVESDMSEIIKNLASISKIFGLDAASKLAAQQARIANGLEQPESGCGFIEALDEARPDAWDIEDTPPNLIDSAGVMGEDDVQ